tara:strand:+ start:81 stop:794 length:714 start_codon:yes stop_codon:yes gene_type:complete
MRLIIDVGNTNIKLAIFKGDVLCKFFIKQKISKKLIEDIMHSYPAIDMIFSCNTNQKNKIGKQMFSGYNIQFFDFSSIDYMPIFSSYHGQLGEDRLALSTGGIFFYGKNVLIIDLGTCITYDVVLNGKYEGGQISPGLQTRLNALYKSTSNLPRLDFVFPDTFIGKSTQECILSGVFFGMLSELELMIKRYTNEYDVEVIMTGGDSKYFQKYMKNVIFDDNLLMKGLNCILNENFKN